MKPFVRKNKGCKNAPSGRINTQNKWQNKHTRQDTNLLPQHDACSADRSSGTSPASQVVLPMQRVTPASNIYAASKSSPASHRTHARNPHTRPLTQPFQHSASSARLDDVFLTSSHPPQSKVCAPLPSSLLLSLVPRTSGFASGRGSYTLGHLSSPNNIAQASGV